MIELVPHVPNVCTTDYAIMIGDRIYSFSFTRGSCGCVFYSRASWLSKITGVWRLKPGSIKVDRFEHLHAGFYIRSQVPGGPIVGRSYTDDPISSLIRQLNYPNPNE